MNDADKALLSAEQQGELKAYERMFASAGWQLLATKLQEEYEAYGNAYDQLSDVQQLGKAQGIRYALNRVLNYPKLVEAYYSALAADVAAGGPEPEVPESDDNWA